MIGWTVVSIASGRAIPMQVKFVPVDNETRYNLSLGIVDGGDADVPGNGDADLILKTVERIIAQFIIRFPRPNIYFQGRTRSLNRLYRIYLSCYHAQIILMSDVYGYKDGEWRLTEKNTEYESYSGTRRGNRDFNCMSKEGITEKDILGYFAWLEEQPNKVYKRQPTPEFDRFAEEEARKMQEFLKEHPLRPEFLASRE